MPPLGIPLQLRGQSEPVYLRVNANALAMIEGQAGQGVPRLLEAGMVLSALRLILWAGARGRDPTAWRGRADPSWSPEAAGDMLQAHFDAGGMIDELKILVEEALNIGERPPTAPATNGQAPAPASQGPSAPPSPTG